MATIAEQLMTLFTVKQNLKIALTNKGINMTGVTFNEYASKIRMLALDKASPVITFTAPSSGATLTDTTPTITANITDANGINISTLKITLGSTTLSYNSSGVSYSAITNGYSISYTPTSALSSGSYTVSISVSDSIGKSSTVSRSFTINSWVTKSGSFLKMTGNSSPSPLSCSISNAYGQYTCGSNYWYAFDNTSSNTLSLTANKPEGSTQNAFVGVKCSFGKIIKVNKIALYGGNWYGSGDGYQYGYSLLLNGTDVFTITGLRGAELSSGGISTPNGIEADAIQVFVRSTAQGSSVTFNVGYVQITEWQELA